jgi:hypothetical protein
LCGHVEKKKTLDDGTWDTMLGIGDLGMVSSSATGELGMVSSSAIGDSVELTVDIFKLWVHELYQESQLAPPQHEVPHPQDFQL